MLDRFLLFPRRSPLRTNVSRLTFFLHAGPRISTVLSTQLISFSVRWKRERTLERRPAIYHTRFTDSLGETSLGIFLEKTADRLCIRGTWEKVSRNEEVEVVADTLGRTTCPANSEITRRPHERINKLSRGKGPTITPRCSIPVFPLGPFLQGEIMNFDIQPASGVMKFSSHLSSRLLFPSTTFISTRVRGTKFISLARMVVVDGKITRPITYR